MKFISYKAVTIKLRTILNRQLFYKVFAIIIIFPFLVLWGCSSSATGGINTDNPDSAFSIAKDDFNKGNCSDAVNAFSFLSKIATTSYADQIQFYLAESYYCEKEYINAVFEYEKMEKNFSASRYYPESLYKIGLCYYYLRPKYTLDQEYTERAIESLQRFINLFPSNPNALDASKKLFELFDELAQRNFMVAKQYMILEDYTSASIYFEYVCENYLESSYAEESFVDRAEALIDAKKYKDAGKTLDWFFKLFKNSKYQVKADNLKNSIPK